MAPNVGGSPHSHSFSQPSFSNQAKLSGKFETFRIGVIACTFISKLLWRRQLIEFRRESKYQSYTNGSSLSRKLNLKAWSVLRCRRSFVISFARQLIPIKRKE